VSDPFFLLEVSPVFSNDCFVICFGSNLPHRVGFLFCFDFLGVLSDITVELFVESLQVLSFVCSETKGPFGELFLELRVLVLPITFLL